MNEERRRQIRRFTDHSTLSSDPPRKGRVSWGAILAGVVIALATQILLGALGLAIGLTAMDPGQGARASSFGMGAGVWWLLSGIVALFLGGWTAGRLANVPRRLDGGLHGFATWGLATLFAAWMLTSAVGGVLGGAWSAVSTAATTTATTAAAQPDLADRANDLLRRAGVDPSQADDVVSRLRGEASTPEAKEKARRAAEQAQDAASTASWFLFGMLLLGALASTFGGAKGAPDVVDEINVRSQPERTSAAG